MYWITSVFNEQAEGYEPSRETDWEGEREIKKAGEYAVTEAKRRAFNMEGVANTCWKLMRSQIGWDHKNVIGFSDMEAIGDLSKTSLVD